MLSVCDALCGADVYKRQYQGGTWALYLFGTSQGRLDSGLRVALALAAIGVIFVVFLLSLIHI